MSPHTALRIGMVQFAPKIGCVQDNIRKVNKLCAGIQPHSVDLLCLPEMVFTGYVFPNANAISPFLEEPRTGPTSQFCKDVAARLQCYVMAGYPERLAPHEVATATLEDGSVIEQVGANSAIMYAPDGTCVGCYRKTNLYETDMTWAKPGTGFVTFHLPPPLGIVSVGICMDLNTQPPATWNLKTGPYEIADYCVAQNTNLLVLLNAWLDSKEDIEHARDGRTVGYWAARLRPLWAREDMDGWPSDYEDPNGEDDPEGAETIVVVCNRSGEENGKTFAGSSSLFSMRREAGSPRLLRVMDRRSSEIQIWTVPVPHTTSTDRP